MPKTQSVIALLIVSFLFVPAFALGHQDVWLKNEQGDRITQVLNSSDPYSPKRTCGGCHDYSIITSGYPFISKMPICGGVDEKQDKNRK